MDKKQQEVYTLAMIIIQQHGDKAIEIATQNMQSFDGTADIGGAETWLAIMDAINKLQVGNQNIKQDTPGSIKCFMIPH